MTKFPSGTVTFLFTDIEGSTRLAHEHPAAMPGMLARHNEILTHSIRSHDGHVFQTAGDAFYAVFSSAPDALNAALDAQQLLYHETWSPCTLKVRMGIHTGLAQAGNDGKYSGYTTLAMTQRMMSAGHGGQILLSSTTYELLRDCLPLEPGP